VLRRDQSAFYAQARSLGGNLARAASSAITVRIVLNGFAMTNFASTSFIIIGPGDIFPQ